MGQLLCGQHMVHVRIAIDGKLRALRFKLLGRAGHDGDNLDVLAVGLELFGKHRLQQGTKHRLRRAAGGKIGQQFREVLLRVLHPSRAAGGEHGQSSASRLAPQELRAFFDHREIGGERCVVDLVEAEKLECGNYLTGCDLSGLSAEALAQTHTHGRSNLHNDLLGGIGEHVPDRIFLGFHRQRAGGADALPAVDALHVAKLFAEGRLYAGLVPAVREVDGTDALDLPAHAHAIAAEHALVRVAHKRWGRIVHRNLFMHGLEAHVLHAQPLGQALQLAVGAARAGRAALVVVC